MTKEFKEKISDWLDIYEQDIIGEYKDRLVTKKEFLKLREEYDLINTSCFYR